MMFNKMKDVALSKGAKVAINGYIKEYGKMLKLNLDSQKKRMEVEVMLKGEKEPLRVEIGRYEFIEENGKSSIEIHNIQTSRAWINTIAGNYLEGKTFEIPEEYAQMLKMIV